MARWRIAWQAVQADPTVRRAYAYQDWVGSTGACVRESRHRLMLSGTGLAALVVVTSGLSVVRRARKNLRHGPTELAGI